MLGLVYGKNIENMKISNRILVVKLVLGFLQRRLFILFIVC